MTLKQALTHNLLNIPGWRTKRHIVVIESDDWGSIRMPSLNAYEELVSNGVKFGKHGFEQVDTIASCDDLEHLFDVCSSFTDINGNPLVITANAVVANPDFEKIRESGYCTYSYEPITETMKRYYPDSSPIRLWKSGFDAKVFVPQLHGREHVNVGMWMNTLRNNWAGSRQAFDKGVFSILIDKQLDERCKHTAAFDFKTREELDGIKQSVIEGAMMFESLFGYKSKSFIAPSYKWNSEIEQVLANAGVKYIQAVPIHMNDGKREFIYVGKRNRFGQIYLNRTTTWEPSQDRFFDWNSYCLKNVDIAFRWHKPATISIHRLNFVGALVESNRDRNLRLFKSLITNIQKQWPDVEFMTSEQLGDIITK